MEHSWPTYNVLQLQDRGLLLVEDGNHGEHRPRPNEILESGEGVFFIRAADIGNGQIIFRSASKINAIALARIRKGIGKPGDVLLSHKGTVGKLALAPIPCPQFVCSPQTTFWRTLNEDFLDRRYLYYFMGSQAFSQQMLMFQNETDMAGYVSLTNQRKFELVIPPITIQRAIVQTISAFDDKIELNRQMNATLEEMARALFKSWFVDFDPVRRNQAGGPNQPYDHLFPDELVESDGGRGRDIPSGWRIKPLDEIADYQNGLALQNFPPKGDEYLPVIKIRELRQGFADGNSDKASPNIKESCILHDGDVVFSWSGSLLVDIWCDGKGALNQHLFKVISKIYPKWFYYYWTKHHLDEFQTIAAGKATTMGHIQRKHLSSAETLVPPIDLLQAMTSIMEAIVEKMITNRLESRTLAQLRDILLPRLMSGQLRIPLGEKDS